MKKGYYVICRGMDWCVAKWNGTTMSKGTKVGPVRGSGTNYFDKAHDLARQKNFEKKTGVEFDNIYQPKHSRD